MHLIFNMLYLWIFGDNIEDRLGRGRYLLLYLLTGVAGNLAHIMTDPHSPIPWSGRAVRWPEFWAPISSLFPGQDNLRNFCAVLFHHT